MTVPGLFRMLSVVLFLAGLSAGASAQDVGDPAPPGSSVPPPAGAAPFDPLADPLADPLSDPLSDPLGSVDASSPDGTALESGVVGEGIRPGTGAPVQPELLPGVLDSQIKVCWSVPVVAGDPAEGGLARIRVKLLPDGTLAQPPAIIDKPAGRLGLVFAESAAAAIAKCAPYRLPPEQYETWKEMMIQFDTLDF